MKILELFSGYGTSSFALKRLGLKYELVGYSDIDKYANQIFKNNHCPCDTNDKLRLGDVTKIDPNTLPDFDLLTGGFPCQAFSIAGKGLGEADPRGTLFYEIIRIAEVKQPKFMLLENVKGLTSSTFKKTFLKIISELGRIGYNVSYKVLNTKDYGIPQNRERIWFVCIRHDLYEPFRFQFPKKEKLKIFLKDILEVDVEKKYYLSSKAQERFIDYINQKSTSDPVVLDLYNKKVKNDGISITLTEPHHNNLRIIESDTIELKVADNGVCNTITQAFGRKGHSKEELESIRKVANCIDANCFKGVTPKHHFEKNKRNISINDNKIRRLTPKECFRLQGFINDEIILDGLSDTQLYKLAGNGQSVNVVEKILKNMIESVGGNDEIKNCNRD